MLGNGVRLRVFVAQQRDVGRNAGCTWGNASAVQGGFLRVPCKYLVVQAIPGTGLHSRCYLKHPRYQKLLCSVGRYRTDKAIQSPQSGHVWITASSPFMLFHSQMTSDSDRINEI